MARSSIASTVTRGNMYQPSTYLLFNGASNSYVATSVTNIIPDGTLECGGAVWVYMNSLGTGSTDGIRDIIGNKRDSVTQGWVWKIANKAKDCAEFAFWDTAGSSQGWITDTQTAYGRWCHLAFSYSGRKVTFYVDGNKDPKTSDSTVTDRFISEYTGQNIRIGHRQAAGSTFETFSGGMSDLCLWGRQLTDAEVLNMYNNRVIDSTSLLARWKMDEGSGTTITDTVGGVVGTLTGGVTWATTALNTPRSVATSRETASSRSAA